MLSIFDEKPLSEDSEESRLILELIVWIVIPFIPLYLSLGNPSLFFMILFGYLVFFLIMDIFVMHYSLMETCVFLLFFLFAVFFLKSLSDYEVIDGKEIVNIGVMGDFF